MKHFSRTTHYLAFNDLELPVQHEPAGHIDPLVEQIGNRIVLGYLSYDSDCENPLDDCEGMGSIHYMGRDRGSREDEAIIYRAMGLDRYGEPNLDLVERDTVHQHFKDRLMKEPDFYLQAVRLLKTEPLQVDWDTLSCAYSGEEGNLIPSATEDEAFRDAWQKMRDAGEIGDRDAVVLDVYEHGGMVLSISGEGMQCRWDTSRGGAMWLPDDEARKEIDSRAQLYRYGSIQEVELRSVTAYHVHPWKQAEYGLMRGDSIAAYPTWREARQALELLKDAPDVVIAPEKLARETAAEEICRSSLEEYNAWLAGDCYGMTVEVFEVEGEQVKPVEDDSCWGFIGQKWAESELKCHFESEVKRQHELLEGGGNG